MTLNGAICVDLVSKIEENAMNARVDFQNLVADELGLQELAEAYQVDYDVFDTNQDYDLYDAETAAYGEFADDGFYLEPEQELRF